MTRCAKFPVGGSGMTTLEVPGYSQLEEIGAGGFAVVYKATQDAVGREVALKLLHSGSADEDTVRRFERECRAVGSLSWHPHIAAVLDAGFASDGQQYLAFELLSGGSLEDLLEREGSVDWKLAVDYMIQTADAVAAAHGEDVLHRDIKPGNILLDRLGKAKLADFGIAQMRDGTKTNTGIITATIAHAAPEVLNGERASKLSDVYLLGSTLFELVVGEPPFGRASGGDFFAVIKRIGTEPPPRLEERAAAPQALGDVIERAMAKLPHERYESAATFGQALRQVQRAGADALTPMPFADLESATRAEAATPGDVVEQVEPVGVAEETLPAEAEESARDEPAGQEVSPAAEAALAPEPEPRPDTVVIAADDRSLVGHPPPTASSTVNRSPWIGWAAGLLLLAGLGAGGWLLIGGNGSGGPSDRPGAVSPVEVLQTEAQFGMTGELAIDGDLSTGWLSPDRPDGHEIVVGFGELVELSEVIIHAGPDPDSGELNQSRGLGPVVLRFSDGETERLDLDPDLTVQTVDLAGRATSSLGIRSLSPGVQPIALRELEFTGVGAP